MLLSLSFDHPCKSSYSPCRACRPKALNRPVSLAFSSISSICVVFAVPRPMPVSLSSSVRLTTSFQSPILLAWCPQAQGPNQPLSFILHSPSLPPPVTYISSWHDVRRPRLRRWRACQRRCNCKTLVQRTWQGVWTTSPFRWRAPARCDDCEEAGVRRGRGAGVMPQD